jgi:hypothetical protein
MTDRDIYLVIRRAIKAILGAFDKRFNVQPNEN